MICSPIDRLRKVVLPFDADVWVPLADDPHVLLKHPPVASGDAEHRRHRSPAPQRARHRRSSPRSRRYRAGSSKAPSLPQGEAARSRVTPRPRQRPEPRAPLLLPPGRCSAAPGSWCGQAPRRPPSRSRAPRPPTAPPGLPSPAIGPAASPRPAQPPRPGPAAGPWLRKGGGKGPVPPGAAILRPRRLTRSGT